MLEGAMLKVNNRQCFMCNIDLYAIPTKQCFVLAQKEFVHLNKSSHKMLVTRKQQ